MEVAAVFIVAIFHLFNNLFKKIARLKLACLKIEKCRQKTRQSFRTI
jgi:hypothetical protein